MKKVFKWIIRLILGVIGLIFLLLIIGFIYEHIARPIASHKIKPSGEFVSVGDHQLHYVKKSTGAPTVLFEAGNGPGGHLSWKYVQEEIAKNTTTISYDRAGILWSERGKDAKSLTSITSDLHNLLLNTNCPKPYILVGHSFAGIGLRKFIDDQKNDISGIVLVDVVEPGYLNRYSDELKAIIQPEIPVFIMKAMYDLGIFRIMVKNIYPNLQKNDSLNIISNKMYYKGVDASAELTQNLEFIQNEASMFTSFDSIPLIIVTGASANRYDEIADEELRIEAIEVWQEMQRDLLNLSTNSKQILAHESGHSVQTDQPEIVIEAIESILNQNKSEND